METKVYIQNLKCGGCANTIRSRMQGLEGISEVLVSNEDDSVSFHYNSSEQLSAVNELLSKLGYPIAGEANSLTKKAKSYVSCAVGRMKN